MAEPFLLPSDLSYLNVAFKSNGNRDLSYSPFKCYYKLFLNKTIFRLFHAKTHS